MPKANLAYRERCAVGRWRVNRELRQNVNRAQPERNVGNDGARGNAALHPNMLRANAIAQRDADAEEVRQDEQGDADVHENDGRENPNAGGNEEEGLLQNDSDVENQDTDDDEEDNDNGEDPQDHDDQPMEEDIDDGESDDEFEPHYGLGGHAPLYEGAPLSVKESMVIVLSLMLNHNLTRSCVADLLTAINLHCPRQGLKKHTYFKFNKFYACSKVPMNKKYYCSHCFHKLEDQNQICPSCGRQRGVSYFVQLPLIPQLREMYKRDYFYNNLQHKFNRVVNDGEIEDIYDAALYKEHVQHGLLSDRNNISLIWYTDGVQVFNSKTYSIWPFTFIINELPYRMRMKRENILMAGLWFGPKKPSANLFMNSFVSDLRKLLNGVNFSAAGVERQILVHAIVLSGVCDTPAKSTFLNSVGHNGFYGCPVCEIRGETLQRQGETDKHVYRYAELGFAKRNVRSYYEYARRAIHSPDPVHGIKGPTLLRVFMPDFVRGMALDPMHLVTGVVKKLLKLHFSENFSAERFSVRQVLAVADQELLNIKPPNFIHRRASSLEEYNRWKASELMAWFFHYSLPIYNSILSPHYFNHYLKFVTAISYLNSSKVSHDFIAVAEQLLKDFVKDFETLYDLKFSSINIHLLLHLADCVRELGPLWSYSCFPLENFNGLIIAGVHGKTNVDSQVCTNFWQVLTLARKLTEVPEGAIHDFCTRRRRSLKISERIDNSCYVVGSFSEVIRHVIHHGLEASNIAPGGKLSEYLRLLKNGIVYVAERYTRAVASTSSYVAFQYNNEIRIGSVITFVKIRRCPCEMNDCPCQGDHFAIIRFADRVENFRIPRYPNYFPKYIQKYNMTPMIRAIPVSQLQSVCIYMNVFNSIFISQPVNSMEVE